MGTGTEVRFDLDGGLPGNLELILVKLEEDFPLVCLVHVKSEEEDGQQTSCREYNNRQIFSHDCTPVQQLLPILYHH